MQVDYGDPENIASIKHKTIVNFQGIHMMIINDRKNVFYPILQLNIERISMALENQSVGLKGDTEIKVMISYYNNSLDVWEPFLEKTTLRLSIEQDAFSTLFYACFKTPMNINFTEELIENVLHAYMSFEKTKQEEE